MRYFRCISSFLILLSCAPADRQDGGESLSPPSWQPGSPQWQQTVAAARREGKVVLSGPTREVWRRELLRFEQDFPGIEVEYTGANSRDFWPRIFRERELGHYLWDLRVGGADPQVFEARDRGVLDPVRPLLLLPEVVDGKNWFRGLDGLFFDREREYVLGFVTYISFVAYVNRDVVPETELRSTRELTQPRWKGKIVLQDPRGGAGLTALQTILKVHGEDHLRDLLKEQDIVVANDLRQQAEWLIRGRYPIAMGITPDAFLVFQDQGLKLNIQPIPDGGVAVSTGTGGIQFFHHAPHPNAAKVFINWLLTREVQSRLSSVTRMNSSRTDVVVAHPQTAPDPRRNDAYLPLQTEEFLPLRERAVSLATEWLP